MDPLWICADEPVESPLRPDEVVATGCPLPAAAGGAREEDEERGDGFHISKAATEACLKARRHAPFGGPTPAVDALVGTPCADAGMASMDVAASTATSIDASHAAIKPPPFDRLTTRMVWAGQQTTGRAYRVV